MSISIDVRLALALLLAGCTCRGPEPGTGGGTTGSSSGGTTTSTAEAEPDWDALLAELAATPTERPPEGPALVESGPGNMNLTIEGASGEDEIGSLGTVKQADLYLETWALRDPALLRAEAGRKVRMGYDRGKACITKGDADALCAGDTTGCAYQEASMLVGYKAFPADATVGKLKDQLPTGTSRAETFAIYTIGLDKPPSETAPDVIKEMPVGTVLSGRLYRETLVVDGKETWKDFWVFYENYWLVSRDVSTRMVAVTDAASDPECRGPHSSLKDMLTEVKAGTGCTAAGHETRPAVKWYAPVSYGWAAKAAPDGGLSAEDCLGG